MRSDIDIKRDVEAELRWNPDIEGITNLIHIQQRVPPAEIKEKIEDAFRRSAELDAARITVETDGGTVILKGTVRSWNWIAISP
jgi:osmotically-inducible protein OsmY